MQVHGLSKNQKHSGLESFVPATFGEMVIWNLKHL